MSLSWPAPVAAVGPVAVGCIAWTHRGRHHLTVIVKAAHALSAGEVMTAADPDPITLDDIPFPGPPPTSVASPSDLAPAVARAEVVVTGRAYPRGDRGEARLAVVTDDGRRLVDKRLRIMGPGPVPLVWERSYGGIGFADNPIGAGLGGVDEPTVLAADGDARAASFAPIPRIFPARRALLAGAAKPAVTGVRAEIPEGFDWRYYQCAPSDQQVEVFGGDESLILEGLTATKPILRTRLPGGRGVARIFDEGIHRDLLLRLELLHVEPDRMRCTAVWRGRIELGSPEALGKLVVAGSYLLAGMPAIWPDDPTELRATTEIGGGARAPQSDDFGATRVIEPTSDNRPFDATTTIDATSRQSGPALPFASGGARPRTAQPAPPGAPWSGDEGKSVVAPTTGLDRTMTVDDFNASDAEAAVKVLRDAAATEALNARVEVAATEAAKERAEEKHRESERRAAEARRQAQAEQFEREQREAAEAEQRRAAAEEAERRERASKVRAGAYGRFKRKG